MPLRDELGNMCNHKVRLHFKSIGTPNIPEFTALRNMQKVYGQYAIMVEFASGESLGLTAEDTVIMDDVDVSTCNAGVTSTEQNSLFTMGSFQAVTLNDIVVYYVNKVTTSAGKTLAGCAAHPEGRPSCVVGALGSPWTLAHEVGHVLGLPHFMQTSANVMFTPTASISLNPPQFTAAQLTTIRSSPCVRRC